VLAELAERVLTLGVADADLRGLVLAHISIVRL
jgi:hypothetical protein